MNNMKIYAYDKDSQSAKFLAEMLGVKRLKHDGKAIKVDTLLNWGSSNIKRLIDADEILNEPDAVKLASNKLKAFQAFTNARVSTVPFTQSKDIAKAWLIGGHTVVVRHKLKGHSGEGIELLEGDIDVPDAPLYTRYVKKTNEYRVHVFNGEAIFLQRKARKKDVEDEKVNWKIRNHANGFVFAHKDVDVPIPCILECCSAVASLGLDFGAVDVGWNKYTNTATVYEVNTAPGLEGSSLDAYVEKLKEYV